MTAALFFFLIFFFLCLCCALPACAFYLKEKKTIMLFHISAFSVLEKYTRTRIYQEELSKFTRYSSLLSLTALACSP